MRSISENHTHVKSMSSKGSIRRHDMLLSATEGAALNLDLDGLSKLLAEDLSDLDGSGGHTEWSRMLAEAKGKGANT